MKSIGVQVVRFLPLALITTGCGGSADSAEKCFASSDGRKICFEKQNVSCSTYESPNGETSFNCRAAGIMKDLAGNASHWQSDYEMGKFNYGDTFLCRTNDKSGKNIFEGYNHKFTCLAAKHFKFY